MTVEVIGQHDWFAFAARNSSPPTLAHRACKIPRKGENYAAFSSPLPSSRHLCRAHEQYTLMGSSRFVCFIPHPVRLLDKKVVPQYGIPVNGALLAPPAHPATGN